MSNEKSSFLFVVVGKFKVFRKPSKFRQKKFSKNGGKIEKSINMVQGVDHDLTLLKKGRKCFELCQTHTF